MVRFGFLTVFLWFAAPSFAQNALKSPNVSANALFLGRHSNYGSADLSEERNGIDLQEAEVAFYADVDPYSRLNVLLSIHPEYTVDEPNHKVSEEWVVEPEELFAESNHVPSLTMKLGKFKAAFGKHNPLHTHAFPFVDAPLVNSTLLGAEGLSDTGASGAYLIPIPWFSEFTAQYLRGEGENKEFHSTSPNDGVAVARWKNLWDVSESTTLEAGLSYACGGNSIGGLTQLAGADLTLKWRPVQGGKYHSGILGAEYITRTVESAHSTQNAKSEDEKGLGYNVWSQYQFAERWAALARYDHLKTQDAKSFDPDPTVAAPDDVNANRYTGAIVFNATEFSTFRFQYEYAEGPKGPKGETVERKYLLQANFTIGAHPAHAY